MDIDGNKIKEIRKKNGITLRQLGSELNISYTTLSRIENGEFKNYNLETLKRIAIYFNVKLTDFQRDPEKNLQSIVENSYNIKKIINDKLYDIKKFEKHSAIESNHSSAYINLDIPYFENINDYLSNKTPLIYKPIYIDTTKQGDYIYINYKVSFLTNSSVCLLIRIINTINNGDIAMIIINEQTLLKKIYYKNDLYFLVDPFQHSDPMILSLKDFVIVGVVVSIQFDI